jgi:hypothetical protein
MTDIQKVITDNFSMQLGEGWDWITLKRPSQKAYRILYETAGQCHSIEIVIKEDEGETAKGRAQRLFEINSYSAFKAENIPLFCYEHQTTGLDIWGCRYRWVDGGAVGDRVQQAFLDVDGKIVQFTYRAEPEAFDQGLVGFIKLIQSIELLNLG